MKWGLIFDISGREAEIARQEEMMAKPGFWDDQAAAQATIKQLNALKRPVTAWKKALQMWEDTSVLLELALEEGDEATANEACKDIEQLATVVRDLELSALLDGEYDSHNAYLSIHPGAGGTESQDWAEMLLRMYTRWAEEQGYQVETIDLQPGEEAGIKSATLLIKGENAYGYLQGEKGVHRLVRISPFDASGRRHTSFASVDVMPEVEDEGEIEIDPADLRIDTYRASGAGGQYVNKTESAVRITHLPTNIVVQCQNERSQHANREAAMKLLRARLLEKKMEEQAARMAELRGEQEEIAWGSQIRSYVFCPYTMVKDHRTGCETGNVDAVMDGELNPFIEAYLRWSQKDARP